jgi:hypothetical protein
MLEIEKVAVVSHEMREVQRRGGTFHIHLRGFFSSITPHVAAAVIPVRAPRAAKQVLEFLSVSFGANKFAVHLVSDFSARTNKRHY